MNFPPETSIPPCEWESQSRVYCWQLCNLEQKRKLVTFQDVWWITISIVNTLWMHPTAAAVRRYIFNRRTVEKPHRHEHHDVYHPASFGSAAPPCCINWHTGVAFRLELLGSVWTSKCGELASLCCRENVWKGLLSHLSLMVIYWPAPWHNVYTDTHSHTHTHVLVWCQGDLNTHMISLCRFVTMNKPLNITVMWSVVDIKIKVQLEFNIGSMCTGDSWW